MARISKWKKFQRVFRRKLLKSILAAVVVSMLIYVFVSNLVLMRKVNEVEKPQFVISRISNEFEETEFMYLLLVVQELRDDALYPELVELVNQPYPAICSAALKKKLEDMNWNSFAFQVRVKKMFSMYETYQRALRLKETASFLIDEVTARRLPVDIVPQIRLLEIEYQKMLSNDLTAKELAFVEKYGGVIQSLQKN